MASHPAACKCGVFHSLVDLQAAINRYLGSQSQS
jgi:hypothetical protein